MVVKFSKKGFKYMKKKMKKLLLILIAIMFIACDNATEPDDFTIYDIEGEWYWHGHERSQAFIDIEYLPNCILGNRELTYDTGWQFESGPNGNLIKWTTRLKMVTRDSVNQFRIFRRKDKDNHIIEFIDFSKCTSERPFDICPEILTRVKL